MREAVSTSSYGRVIYNYDDRKERIVNYWERRSESFLKQRRDELHDPIADRWLEEILPFLPKGKMLRILDAGCGTGFFSILLAKQGHQVVGTDLTKGMIENAGILAGEELGESVKGACSFYLMDAENLDFEDESFDAVISRNLTWTLPHPITAYGEWLRVLKPGGVLINFDANYGKSNFSDTSALPENHAHHMLGDDMMRECEAIKRQLPISACARPAWDLDILGKLGVQQFSVDLGVGSRIYQEIDEFYNPTPIFRLVAGKV